MRSVSILTALAVVVSTVLVTTPANATDLEDLQKKVGKVAVPIGAKPKAFCTCPNFIPGEAIAGRLVQTTHLSGPTTFVKVICEVQGFDAQGTFVGLASCDDFTVLAK
jgi:hypothetical protein